MSDLNFMINLHKRNKIESIGAKADKSLRGAVHEGFDKPAEEKTAKDVPIRLCYIAMDGVKQNPDGKVIVGTIYGASSVYKLPQGMSLEEAGKVVSYLTEKIEKKNELEKGSELGVRIVATEMGNFGFRRYNYKEADFSHAFAESELDESQNTIVVSTGPASNPHIDGVVDFMTIGGDQSLFLCSDLAGKQFSWFTPSVSFEEVKKIYEKIGYKARFDGASKVSSFNNNERSL